MSDFTGLAIAGRVATPTDPDWDEARLAWNLVADQRPEAVAFADLSGPGSGSPLLLTELRHLGGALGRPDPSGGALSHIDAEFAMFGVGMPMTPELGEAIGAHLDRFDETMRPWAAEGGYYNFAERPCDADAILPADVCARLTDVKRKWDPDGVIVANHSVSLETA